MDFGRGAGGIGDQGVGVGDLMSWQVSTFRRWITKSPGVSHIIYSCTRFHLQVHGYSGHIPSLLDRSLSNNDCLCRGFGIALLVVLQLELDLFRRTSLAAHYYLSFLWCLFG